MSSSMRGAGWAKKFRLKGRLARNDIETREHIRHAIRLRACIAPGDPNPTDPPGRSVQLRPRQSRAECVTLVLRQHGRCRAGSVAHALIGLQPAHRERTSTDPYGIMTPHERRLLAKEPRWCRRLSREDAEPQGPTLAAAATMCRQDRNAKDSSSVR